ncbi:DUF1415 domain-containing protein [Salinivibrio sp. ES.052]|uniref:DUF1415 domain-containing protein n=1 Tax=Salinivibrio sp. ES.052 TaxID=1882823 RepID=UPI000926EF31|nr:DUF1415 domain-containing protein [Salinivibrio sp. ES.052]SIO34583.1 hypothetical protein SAMN05444724_2856 [Salinivibrio sp. ES.052]
MNTVETQMNTWLDDVVIGLNLCPFAAKPRRNQQIHLDVCDAEDDAAILETVYHALVHLAHVDSAITDTTVVVVPNALADFEHYLDLIDATEAMIDHYNWRGIFQVASFHPNYCFEGCAPEDSENLTNRSPYPCFHLIREASMSRALDHYGQDPDLIPAHNIASVSALTPSQRQILFPWINDAQD